jgi:hypothetical protein
MIECKTVDVDFASNARFRFNAEREINATPEHLFELFEDADAWPAWAMPITNVEWTSPKPYDIGTTRTVSMIGGMIGEEVFIAWERGKHMAFCFTRCNMPGTVSFSEDYRVTDLGNGRCRLSWTMALHPEGASKVSLILFGPLMNLGLSYLLKSFARYAETH